MAQQGFDHHGLVTQVQLKYTDAHSGQGFGLFVGSDRSKDMFSFDGNIPAGQKVRNEGTPSKIQSVIDNANTSS